jgi:hypothetical protein
LYLAIEANQQMENISQAEIIEKRVRLLFFNEPWSTLRFNDLGTVTKVTSPFDSTGEGMNLCVTLDNGINQPLKTDHLSVGNPPIENEPRP